MLYPLISVSTLKNDDKQVIQLFLKIELLQVIKLGLSK